MNLHEYQAKQLFRDYGLPVSQGIVCSDSDAVVAAISAIDGDRWVVKAQIHAGGRGKAGGVKLVSSAAEARAFAEQWLGKRMVTYQSDADGQPVNQILVESCTDIASELYLSAVVDRSSRRIVFMASSEGGVEIEKVAAETPEKIFKTSIDPLTGALPYQARSLGYKLGFNPQQVKQFVPIFLQLARLFQDKDLSLLEINPLVITSDGKLHCLDAKINIDGNALYRHADLQQLHDPSQEDARELQAAEHALNYVALDGNIGCMVNGAGLAMATMDNIKLNGGNPANFLDVGGGATKERVTEAFRIILSDSQVKVIFINIFGGIVRCDMIAEGIIGAVNEAKVEVPVVVRLEGNQAQLGLEKLQQSGMNIQTVESLQAGAQRSVELAA